MIKRISVFFIMFFMLFCTVFAEPKDQIIHGQFAADRLNHGERGDVYNSHVYFLMNKENGSIDFIYEYNNNKEQVIKQHVDTYTQEGGLPKIESLFFYKVKGKVCVFVLVSWEINHRAIGIYGTSYQVFVYEKSPRNNNLIINTQLYYDKNLQGLEGVNDWKESYFKLNTADAIKQYIHKHYR